MKVVEVFGDLPKLETERLFLRKLRNDDAADIYYYGSNEQVTKYVTWDTYTSIKDAMSFIQFAENRYKEKQFAPWGIVLKDTNKLIGTIDFVSWQPEHKTAEIGYVISEDYWGQGIATEAVKKVIEYGFLNKDIVRIQAFCFVKNIGSARVMEKSGMTFEGILRKKLFIKGIHRDVKVYSILKEEFLQKQGN